VVVAAPQYLKQQKRLLRPEALRDHRLIQFTSLGLSPEWHFMRRGEELTVRFTPIFITNSADAAIGHAERGAGLTLALSYQVSEAVRARRLRVVLEEFEPPPLPIHVLYPSTRLLSAKVRAFLDLVTSTCDWRFDA
jgi:DNA-binding transcriptional LysR family regulator